MSLLPATSTDVDNWRPWRDRWDWWDRSSLAKDDFWLPSYSWLDRDRDRERPYWWRRPYRVLDHTLRGFADVKEDKDSFEVVLDVEEFQPGEIKVKVANNFLTVDGKHEERQDDLGFVKRQFSRRYLLPEFVNPDRVTSNLSSDGILTVHAPKQRWRPLPHERSIPVAQRLLPALSYKPKKKWT